MDARGAIYGDVHLATVDVVRIDIVAAAITDETKKTNRFYLQVRPFKRIYDFRPLQLGIRDRDPLSGAGPKQSQRETFGVSIHFIGSDTIYGVLIMTLCGDIISPKDLFVFYWGGEHSRYWGDRLISRCPPSFFSEFSTPSCHNVVWWPRIGTADVPGLHANRNLTLRRCIHYDHS